MSETPADFFERTEAEQAYSACELRLFHDKSFFIETVWDDLANGDLCDVLHEVFCLQLIPSPNVNEHIAKRIMTMLRLAVDSVCQRAAGIES